MCVHFVGAGATAHTWRSEGTGRESVLSFQHCMGGEINTGLVGSLTCWGSLLAPDLDKLMKFIIINNTFNH